MQKESDADYLPISTYSRLTRGVDFPAYMAEAVKYLRVRRLLGRESHEIRGDAIRLVTRLFRH